MTFCLLEQLHTTRRESILDLSFPSFLEHVVVRRRGHATFGWKLWISSRTSKNKERSSRFFRPTMASRTSFHTSFQKKERSGGHQRKEDLHEAWKCHPSCKTIRKSRFSSQIYTPKGRSRSTYFSILFSIWNQSRSIMSFLFHTKRLGQRFTWGNVMMSCSKPCVPFWSRKKP